MKGSAKLKAESKINVDKHGSVESVDICLQEALVSFVLLRNPNLLVRLVNKKKAFSVPDRKAHWLYVDFLALNSGEIVSSTEKGRWQKKD